MRKTPVILAMGISLVFSFAASAEDGEVEAMIKSVDTAQQKITLDNGNEYDTPSEFNFEGLEPGVTVVIYYSEEGEKKMVDDLIIVE